MSDSITHQIKATHSKQNRKPLNSPTQLEPKLNFIIKFWYYPGSVLLNNTRLKEIRFSVGIDLYAAVDKEIYIDNFQTDFIITTNKIFLEFSNPLSMDETCSTIWNGVEEAIKSIDQFCMERNKKIFDALPHSKKDIDLLLQNGTIYLVHLEPLPEEYKIEES